MKTIILTILLAGSLLAHAVTITVLEDTPGVLDFTAEWGQTLTGGIGTGPGGTTIYWMEHQNRNPNYFFVEIHQPGVAAHGFWARFWSDPEYFGPVPTAFGSPNINFGSGDSPQIFQLDNTPYGARFVLTSAVPEADSAWAMMLMGLAGIATAAFLDRKQNQT
jgi:hypothetical protein